MSNFLPIELAIYKRSTVGSKETISAEFVPVTPFEKLVNKDKFNSLDDVGAT